MSQAEYNVWLDKGRFEDAERVYQEHLAQLRAGGCPSSTANSTSATGSTVAAQGGSGGACKMGARVDTLEKENKQFKTLIDELTETVARLTNRVFQLEYKTGILQKLEISNCPPVKPPTATAAKKDDEAEDDFELFGSDDEDSKEVDAEAERVRQQRLDAYAAKKANKPVLVAKSNIILDVKPWDDETDMAKLEQCVRTIEMDGLLWGASKLVPLAYGIKKLQISCVVEDDKVSTEELEEKILAFEDYIQSMDIAAFNKI